MPNHYNNGAGGTVDNETGGNGNIDITPMPESTEETATMMVYGTNEAYSGLTVLIGGYHYTTVGGALEGNSLQLVPIPRTGRIAAPKPDLDLEGVLPPTPSDNPVISFFTAPASPRYRRSDNNLLVPIGTPLHEHADGTIMTGHSMGPNDNSVVVYEVEVEVGDETNQQNQQNGMNENGGSGNDKFAQTFPGDGNGGDDGGGGTGGGTANRQLNPEMGSNMGGAKGPGDELPGGGM